MIRNAYLLEKIADYRIFRAARTLGGKTTAVNEATGIGRAAVNAAKASDAVRAGGLTDIRVIKQHLAGELMMRDKSISHTQAYKMADKVLEDRLRTSAGVTGMHKVDGKDVHNFSLRALSGKQEGLSAEQLAANKKVLEHLGDEANHGALTKALTGEQLGGKSIFDAQKVTKYTKDPTTNKYVAETAPVFNAPDKTGMKGTGTKLYKDPTYQADIDKSLASSVEKAEKAKTYETKAKAKDKGKGKDGGDYMWPALLGGGAAVGGGYLLTRPSGNKNEGV